MNDDLSIVSSDTKNKADYSRNYDDSNHVIKEELIEETVKD